MSISPQIFFMIQMIIGVVLMTVGGIKVTTATIMFLLKSELSGNSSVVLKSCIISNKTVSVIIPFFPNNALVGYVICRRLILHYRP